MRIPAMALKRQCAVPKAAQLNPPNGTPDAQTQVSDTGGGERRSSSQITQMFINSQGAVGSVLTRGSVRAWALAGP